MSKRVTISDIAREAGVSKTTVSFYLNGNFAKMSESTKRKIEKVIDTYDYTPNASARALNKKRANLIGVIATELNQAFASQCFKGISDVADKYGYQIIAAYSHSDKESELRRIRDMINVVDGFIVEPTPGFEDAAKLIEEAGLPLVCLEEIPKGYDCYTVGGDNEEIIKEAVIKLKEEGYGHVIIVTSDPNEYQIRKLRYDCLRQCLQNVCSYDVAMIENDTSAVQLGETISKHIKEEEKNLIFALSPKALMTTYLAVHPRGSQEFDNIAVLGFDSNDWGENINLPVSTIRHQAYKEGEEACLSVVAAIEGIPFQKNKLLKYQLVWRDEKANLRKEREENYG